MTDKELGIPILSKYKKEEMGELISKYIDNLSKKEKSLLIEKCGISKMQLYNILKGKSIPHYRNFKQIADILNIKEREITKIVEGNIYYFCSYYPFYNKNGKNNIGAAIKCIREMRGLPRKIAAKELDLPYSRLTAFENGSKVPSPIILAKMFDLYRISLTRFVMEVKKLESRDTADSNMNLFYSVIKECMDEKKIDEEELREKIGFRKEAYNRFKTDNNRIPSAKIIQCYIELLEIPANKIRKLASVDNRYKPYIFYNKTHLLKEKSLSRFETDLSMYEYIELKNKKKLKTVYFNCLLRAFSTTHTGNIYKNIAALNPMELECVNRLFKEKDIQNIADTYLSMSRDEIQNEMKNKYKDINIEEEQWKKYTDLSITYLNKIKYGILDVVPPNECIICLSRFSDCDIVDSICFFEASREIINKTKKKGEVLKYEDFKSMADKILFWTIGDKKINYMYINEIFEKIFSMF